MSILIISQRSLSSMMPTLLLLIFLFITSIHGIEVRKLDETQIPGSSDPSVKCGGCSPCGHPSCYLSPPPPSLPPPSPPPPSPPPPSPIKKPPTTTPYCPPPPYSPGYTPPSSPGFVYITAPPGDLYPVVQNYSNSPRKFAAAIKITFGFGLIGFLILWT